jgi:dipeptidyl aminopeptidase/acylaminoacyl peptidase
VWSCADGAPIGAASVDQRPTAALAFAPDGARVLVVGADGTPADDHDDRALIVDPAAGGVAQLLPAPAGRASGVGAAWGAEGPAVLYADGALRTFTDAGALVATEQRHAAGVGLAGHWSAGDRPMVSDGGAEFDGSAARAVAASGPLVVVTTASEARWFDGKRSGALPGGGGAVAVADLAGWIAIADGHGVTLRSARTGSILATSPSAPVRSVAWSPDGVAIAALRADGVVSLATPSGDPFGSLVMPGAFAVALGDDRVSLWSPSGEVRAPSVTDGDARAVPPRPGPAYVTVVGPGPAVGTAEGAVEVAAASFTSLGEAARCAAASVDGRVVAGGSSRTLTTWDAATGEPLLSHRYPSLEACTLTPDGSTLIFAIGGTAPLQAIDSRSGLPRATLVRARPVTVVALAVSADGARVAAALRPAADRPYPSDDPGARVWDLRTGEVVLDVAGMRGGAGALAWSPDGAQLLIGAADGSIRLVDVPR